MVSALPDGLLPVNLGWTTSFENHSSTANVSLHGEKMGASRGSPKFTGVPSVCRRNAGPR